MFTPLLKSLQNNEELIHWKKKKNPEGLLFLELSRGCSEKVTYEKGRRSRKGETKIVRKYDSHKCIFWLQVFCDKDSICTHDSSDCYF